MSETNREISMALQRIWMPQTSKSGSKRSLKTLIFHTGSKIQPPTTEKPLKNFCRGKTRQSHFMDMLSCTHMTTFEQKLKKLRKTIDGIDNKLIVLIEKRLKIAKNIQELKRKNGKHTTDKTRETEILRKIEKKLQNSPAAAITTRIYKECFRFAKNNLPKD